MRKGFPGRLKNIDFERKPLICHAFFIHSVRREYQEGELWDGDKKFQTAYLHNNG